MRLFPRLLAVTAVLLPLLAVAPPASADSSAPELVSAERISPAEVGGAAPITVAWDATDAEGPGSGVTSADFTYDAYDETGAVVGFHSLHGSFTPTAGRSLVTWPLGPWAASGHYRLRQIAVRDGAGNMTMYERDGSIRAHPSVATPPASTVDFASLDFTVANPLSDTATPVIADLAPLSRQVVAGEPIVLTSQVSDDLSGVSVIHVAYTSPSRSTPLSTVADPVLASAGLTSAVVPLRAEGGVWRAVSVSIADRAGNRLIIDRDVQWPTNYHPRDVRPHDQQGPIDFAALDVEVVPLAPDTEAPTLSELTREGPAVLRRGDDVVVRFTAHDDSPIDWIQLDFQDRYGHVFMVRTSCLPERGTAVAQVPPGLDDGPVVLRNVTVVDAQFTVRQYLRDGSAWTQGRQQPDPIPGFDLSALDFELASGPAEFTGHVGAPVVCPTGVRIPVDAPATAQPGDTIELGGEVVRTDDLPLADSLAAVFAEPAGQPAELVEVVTTQADGSFGTRDVIGSVDTTYRVRFLGRDGAQGAEPSTSGAHLVDVSPHDGATGPADPQRVTRLAGPDRIATAVAVSRAGTPAGSARAVVLARGDDYADALAGTPLAARHAGPLLLTLPSSLPASVLNEIRRVLPAGSPVFLLGGERAISRAVEQGVRAAGFSPVRVAGADRYATAVAIADRVTTTPTTVLLATGRSFADALSAGAAAAAVGGVVVLTDGPRMPAATSAYLSRRPSSRYAIGGPAAAADPSATAVVGRDRYDTALLTARRLTPPTGTVGIASGAGFADALAGGAHAARAGAPLLLTPPTALPAAVAEHLRSVGVTRVFVYGGAAAVSDRTLAQISSVLAR